MTEFVYLFHKLKMFFKHYNVAVQMKYKEIACITTVLNLYYDQTITRLVTHFQGN